MALTLEKIKPLHPEFAPSIDPAWERIGLTPSGHQLFVERTKMVRAIPDIDPKTKERRHRLHPTTAEPLYAMNRPEHYTRTRTFYLHSEGNGNIVKIDWKAATDEELAAVAREKGIREMLPELSGTLYDMNMTPVEFTQALQMIARAMKGKDPMIAEEPTPAEEPIPPRPDAETSDQLPDSTANGKTDITPDQGTFQPDPDVVYPRWRGGAGWELSDGTMLKGKGRKTEAYERETELATY